jgi:cell division protein FtsQ
VPERYRPGVGSSSTFRRGGQTVARPSQSTSGGKGGRARMQTRVVGGSRQAGWRAPRSASRRARGGRLLRRARRLALLLPLVALVVGGWWLYQSPWLSIQEVTVEGTRLLDPEYLAGVADLSGDSILFPGTGGARQRLEQVPMVKSVTFERAWPRSMRIVVQERRPWGFWEVMGQRHVIDEDGVVLERVLPDEGAPVIRDLDATGNLEPGDRVDPDAVGLARQLVEEAPQRLGLTLETAEYRERDGLTAIFKGGLRVRFGDGRDFDYKMAALQALLERTGQDGVEVHTVDLRFGERVAFQ